MHVSMTTPLSTDEQDIHAREDTTLVSLPTSNDDGTRTALIAGPVRQLGNALLLPLYLPTGLTQQGVSGRYVLARCGAVTEEERATNWEIYLRRPLYAALHHTVTEPAAMDRWEFLLPHKDDLGTQWLAAQSVGTPINLLGPFGKGYTLQQNSRNLLLLTDPISLPVLLNLSDQMLDRGGRVTLVLRVNEAEDNTAMLLSQLPIPVEVHLAPTVDTWQEQLGETIRWADQIAVALPQDDLPILAQAIRQHRFRFEQGFAHALVQADLVCGVGACLACVVPTREGGYTRACVHGPVFDLATLVV